MTTSCRVRAAKSRAAGHRVVDEAEAGCRPPAGGVSQRGVVAVLRILPDGSECLSDWLADSKFHC